MKAMELSEIMAILVKCIDIDDDSGLVIGKKDAAKAIFSALPEVLEPIEEEGLSKEIYSQLLNYCRHTVIDGEDACIVINPIAKAPKIAHAICSKFGQPKLTDGELERILPEEFGYTGVCDLSVREKFAYNQGWNTCLKVIRENLRK